MSTTRRTRTPGAPASTPSTSTDDQTSDGDQAATTAAVTTEVAFTPAPAVDADLPNAIDIDAKTIRGPVLTKQGWVCPDESGRRVSDSLKV